MSGLILLVIVAAWLAVLVPMALRSHDAGSATRTVDKFHDAMRVLSRRAPASQVVGSQAVGSAAPAAQKSPAPVGAKQAGSRSAMSPAVSRARSMAARRRRVLLMLVVAALMLLVGAALGPAWLSAPALALNVLVVAYVVQLRRQAALRAERDWQRALGDRVPAPAVASARRPARLAPRASPAPAAAPGSARVVRHPMRYATPAHVVGIPNRMPARPVVDPTWVAPAAPAPVAASASPAPARGAQGEPWQPVPVPKPTYLTAAAAPRRVLDLTRPGEWSDGVAAAERDLGIDDQGPDLDDILERRRAAGGW